MTLHGESILGGTRSKIGARTFQAANPATNELLEPHFHESTEAEVARALELATAAFAEYRGKPASQIAGFLEEIGAQIVALGETLIKRAHLETALPEARLNGERTRTVDQLRLFASVVREGSWVDARIDRALPERKPAPRPDLRRMLIPIGPVAVFGASNFPLAFSVAGGDTASALAAGNPVVVKAHPAHPGTSELVAGAIHAAIEKTGMPAGLFSLLHGATPDSGLALVKHPLTKAVGFTGSLKAGRAIFDAAAARSEPIPCYSEMGSTNPIFILPDALKTRGEEIAKGLVQSVTLGVGQFCTNPGLVAGIAGADLTTFIERAAQLASETTPGAMLHAGILERYWRSVEEAQELAGVRVPGKSLAGRHAERNRAPAQVLTTDSATFLKTPKLHEEIFGPATVIVACESAGELARLSAALEGQLTITIHGTEKDLREHSALIQALSQRAGRMIVNGFPTGVEVCAAMNHGGPYPATSDVRSTSVGTAAILRFARPICYQNFPQTLLPVELQNGNERGIWRMLDNELTKAAVV